MRAVDYQAEQAAAMSEEELLDTVRLYGKQLNILVYHTWNSKRSEAGFPDVVLLSSRAIAYRELKREDGRVTAAQQTWLNRLTSAGQDAGLWRPSDLVAGRVLLEMRALASGVRA